MSVTLPLAVSTSIFTALRSGSFIRPADTDAVIAASSLFVLALLAACFAASLAWAAPSRIAAPAESTDACAASFMSSAFASVFATAVSIFCPTVLLLSDESQAASNESEATAHDAATTAALTRRTPIGLFVCLVMMCSFQIATTAGGGASTGNGAGSGGS